MRPSVRQPALVTAGFAGLAILLTWPLLLRMHGSVIGQLGDNMHFAWMIGWFKQALFDLRISPYFAPQLNYPAGWELARSEIPLTLVSLGLPFAIAGNPILGYNAAAMLSFVLSGLAMYIWVRRLTGDAAAGFLAGTIFAFMPFRFAHLRAGHLNALGTFWFPLYFMGFFELLTQRNASRKMALLTGLCFGMVSLTSQYYFYLTALVSLFLAVGYLLTSGRARLRGATLWKNAVVAAVAALPLVAWGVWPYFELSQGGQLPSRSVDAVASGSASVSDYLLPATEHFLWGAWVGERFNRDHWMEGSLYLGVASSALAIVAVARGRRSGNRGALTSLLLGLAGIGLVISLGTHLHWNEDMVRLDLPDRLASALEREDISIRLPGYYLFQAVPYFDRMRTFKRAAIFVLLPVSALAGLGAARWRERLVPRWRSPFAAILLAAVLLDFYPGPYQDFAAVKPRPVDLWLAAQPGAGAVAEFPFDLVEDQAHVYYTLFHGKPFIGGFFNAYPPPQYLRILPAMLQFPHAESIRLLDSLGVEYVLVEGMNDWVEQDGGALVNAGGLRRVIRLDGVTVYAMAGD